jgi:hypothetical protein
MSNDESSFDSFEKKSQDSNIVSIFIFSNIFAKLVRSSSHYPILCTSNVIS